VSENVENGGEGIGAVTRSFSFPKIRKKPLFLCLRDFPSGVEGSDFASDDVDLLNSLFLTFPPILLERTRDRARTAVPEEDVDGRSDGGNGKFNEPPSLLIVGARLR
jgi:hypothetical protein